MFSKALAAVGLAASLSLAPAAPSTATAAASDPPTEKLGIDLVTVNGSGCPKGTVGVSVSPDNARLVLTYSSYLAQVGGGASLVDSRKNCQLNLVLHHPKEYRYAIVETRPLGYAHLEAGAYATVRSSHYFQGSPEAAVVSHRINGPWDDNWIFDDRQDLGALDWEPCGEERNLNINTELRAYAGTSDPKTTTSFITMDTLDVMGGTPYDLVWQRCPGS